MSCAALKITLEPPSFPASLMATFHRSKDNPLPLKTPPGTADFTMHTDTKDGLPILVCTVGKTVLHYDARCIQDLHSMLKNHGDWMDLGGADEQKPAKEDSVEAWGRSPENPVGGWYEERFARTVRYLCSAGKSSLLPHHLHTEDSIDSGFVLAGAVDTVVFVR